MGNRKFVGLAGAIIGDGQRLAGRGRAFGFFVCVADNGESMKRSSGDEATKSKLLYHSYNQRGAAGKLGGRVGQSPQTETVKGMEKGSGGVYYLLIIVVITSIMLLSKPGGGA